MKNCKPNPGWHGLVALLLVGCLLSLPVVAQPDRGQPEGSSQHLMQALPGVTSDYWRDVKGGTTGTTSSNSPGADTLIMVEGEAWRQWRNNWISPGGLIALGGSASALLLFYLLVGSVKLSGPRTGRKIERWTRVDRAIHWYVASLFIILAVTGLMLLYAKWFLQPILPGGAWAAFMTASKNIHNYLGPLFALGLLAMIIKWIRHNAFKLVDLKWFAKGGGIVGKGHPSAGYLNGGEKVWFWIVTLVGLTVVISGLVLDFPNFGQSRETMQTSLIIHGISALVLIAASFGHIYIGTAGTEGAYEGMKTGYVDETWAKQHHDLWYAEVKDQAISEEELQALKTGEPAPAEAKS